jgi:alkylation response protein AidB-like acyl-CoA dehydrogenase
MPGAALQNGGAPRSRGNRTMKQAQDDRLDRGEIVQRARALAPALRERAAEGEAQRRLPDRTIDDLASARVLRVCQPARFGGSELPWDALCEMAVELGRGDGSQGWVGAVYAAMAQMTALFGDEAQHEVWDRNHDTLVAGSLVPVGNRVTATAGGYRLTGKWSFCSGIHHAGWTILGELVDAGDGKREHLYFLIPAADYRIDDDWFTVGMAGTGSASVVLDDVLVPAHRVMLNRDVAAGTTPGAAVNPAPVFRMPLFGFAQLALAAAPIGAAIGMVEDFKTHIRGKSGGSTPIAGLDLLRGRISEAAAETRAATLLLLDAARNVMARLTAGAAVDDADAAVAIRDSGYAVLLAKRAAMRMFEASGGHGLYLSTPIQRAFRDVNAGANHASLAWDRSALRYAQFGLQI